MAKKKKSSARGGRRQLSPVPRAPIAWNDEEYKAKQRAKAKVEAREKAARRARMRASKLKLKRAPNPIKTGGVLGTVAGTAVSYGLGKYLQHRDKMKLIKKRKAEEEKKSTQGRPTKFKDARTVPAPKAKPRKPIPKAKPRKKKRSRRSTEPAAWNYEAGVSDDL